MNPNLRSFFARPRIRKAVRNILIAGLIALPVRAFALAPYKVASERLEPELPIHSRVVVWKLASHFVPGDIAAFDNDGHTYLGRVKSVSAEGLVLNRTGQPDQNVSTARVVGRVILNTR